MAGGERVGAKILRRLEQIGEFDELVAGDAGHRRFAAGVRRGELFDHLLLKAAFEIENKMRNAQTRRDGARGASRLWRWPIRS